MGAGCSGAGAPFTVSSIQLTLVPSLYVWIALNSSEPVFDGSCPAETVNRSNWLGGIPPAVAVQVIFETASEIVPSSVVTGFGSFAVTTLAFAFGRDDFRPEIVRALIAAYAGVRPPTDAERAAFGAELRFAACRFAVTRITDVHLKRHAGAPRGKDFNRYLARLASVEIHMAANDDLLTLPS